MQQNCAVHSRGVYWPALHDPHCPHKGQEQHGTQNGQTADCAPLLAAVVFIHSLFYQFDTLFCIVHAFQPPSTKTVLKVFHLYRYKKSEKLSPENQIFQKKFESCRNSSQKRKKQVILLYRTAEDQTSNRERKWNSLPTACCFLQLKQGTYLIRLNIEKCYHIER